MKMLVNTGAVDLWLFEVHGETIKGLRRLAPGDFTIICEKTKVLADPTASPGQPLAHFGKAEILEVL